MVHRFDRQSLPFLPTASWTALSWPSFSADVQAPSLHRGSASNTVIPRRVQLIPEKSKLPREKLLWGQVKISVASEQREVGPSAI